MRMSYVTYSMWYPPTQIVSQGNCVVTPIDNWHLTTLSRWHRCHGRRCRCRNARKWAFSALDIGTDADDGDCILTGTPETAIGLFVIVSDGIEDADGEADGCGDIRRAKWLRSSFFCWH